MTVAVEIENMSYYRNERAIFDDISIAIPKGKITAIMGPSGTGKTTLLKLVSAQLMPAKGDIKVFGESVLNLSQKALYQLRRKMGMLFQEGGLFTDLSVLENVAFPLREHTRLSDQMIKDLALMHLQAVGLRGAHPLSIDQLSGGMARRVALARAIILGPDIMLYDEPFTGQDPISLGVLVKLIKELNDSLNLTTLIVSHDVHETAAIADWLVILFNGKILAQGEPKEVIGSNTPEVQQFMHGLSDGPVSFHYPAAPFDKELLA